MDWAEYINTTARLAFSPLMMDLLQVAPSGISRVEIQYVRSALSNALHTEDTAASSCVEWLMKMVFSGTVIYPCPKNQIKCESIILPYTRGLLEPTIGNLLPGQDVQYQIPVLFFVPESFEFAESTG